jgi:hypothetical protein
VWKQKPDSQKKQQYIFSSASVYRCFIIFKMQKKIIK